MGEEERVSAEQEAERMWPSGPLNLGKWDGIKISAEQSYLVQRQAFVMGAQWQAKNGR
jgi:hypothetical protein